MNIENIYKIVYYYIGTLIMYNATTATAATTMEQPILENSFSSLIPQQKNFNQQQNSILNVQSQAEFVTTTEQPKIQLTDRMLGNPTFEQNKSKDSSLFNVVAPANGQFIIPTPILLNDTQGSTINLSHANTNTNKVPLPGSSIDDVFNKLSVTNDSNQQQTYNKDNKNNVELTLSNDYITSSQQQPLNQFFLEQTMPNSTETRNAKTTANGKKESIQSTIATINPFTNGQRKEEIPIENKIYTQTVAKKPSPTIQLKNYNVNNGVANDIDLKQFPHFEQIFNDMEENDSPPNIHIDLIPCMNTFMDGAAAIGERIGFIDNERRNSHSNNKDNNNRNMQPSKELVEVMNYPKHTKYKQNINTFVTSPQQYNPSSLRYHHPSYNNNGPNYGYPPPYIGYQSINPIQYNYQNNWNPIGGRQSRGTTHRYNQLNEVIRSEIN